MQRVLAAANVDQARRGAIFGGLLKVLPLFIFVIPGVVAYALAKQGRIELANPDQALPALIGALQPAGLKGLVVAGLLAALMSSLSSVFNSCSTLITWDIYKKLHPEATERTLVWVGQISTIVLVGFGLLWIPMMQLISGQIYQYLQSVQAYISPPIAAAFLIGIFWRRVNAQGAIASFAVGFVLGIGRLVAELNKDSLSGFLYWYSDINFLHFALFLFIVCAAVLVLVSLVTPAPSAQHIAGLTFQTAEQQPERAEAFAIPDADEHIPSAESDPAWRRRDLQLSVVLVVIVGIIWLYFTG